MKRDEALELVRQHLKNNNLVKHCLAVEAVMKHFAALFGEDTATWSLTGLLHDLDYQYTVNEPERHTLVTEEMLQPHNLDPLIIYAIKAHNMRVEPKSRMDWALYCSDPVTGFIIAAALMHPEKKLAALSLEFLQKRFREKSFAKGASREQMQECRKLDLELDRFLQHSLDGMRAVAAELGF